MLMCKGDGVAVGSMLNVIAHSALTQAHFGPLLHTFLVGTWISSYCVGRTMAGLSELALSPFPWSPAGMHMQARAGRGQDSFLTRSPLGNSWCSGHMGKPPCRQPWLTRPHGVFQTDVGPPATQGRRARAPIIWPSCAAALGWIRKNAPSALEDWQWHHWHLEKWFYCTSC